MTIEDLKRIRERGSNRLQRVIEGEFKSHRIRTEMGMEFFKSLDIAHRNIEKASRNRDKRYTKCFKQVFCG